MPNEFEIIVIGAGPAGLAAGLYAARARRRTLLIEKNVTGGQIALTSTIENYPGIDEVNGFDLGQQMLKQAEKYGLQTLYTGVTAIEPRAAGQHHVVRTDEGEFLARAVIVTAGADYNRLDIPGEARLTGYGVSYCATCDGPFFLGKEIAVVGGGDAAMDEGLFLTRFAAKVTVIHRRDRLRASAILQERAFVNPKIDFIWNTVVTAIDGDSAVELLHLRNVVTGEESDLPAGGVFIFIGQTPNTGFLRGRVEMDGGGHAIVNEWMETTLPGIFAAGDVRANSARQIVTAAGDGATAAIRADHYINEHFRE